MNRVRKSHNIYRLWRTPTLSRPFSISFCSDRRIPSLRRSTRRTVSPERVLNFFLRHTRDKENMHQKGAVQLKHDSITYSIMIRVRTIVWKSDSPIVDSIGQNNRPMWQCSDSFRRLLTGDDRRSMNNCKRKSINHAYKHMISSVTDSPQSICTKFTSN